MVSFVLASSPLGLFFFSYQLLNRVGTVVVIKSLRHLKVACRAESQLINRHVASDLYSKVMRHMEEDNQSDICREEPPFQAI